MNRERMLKLLEQLESAQFEYKSAMDKKQLADQAVNDTKRKVEIAKGEVDKALGLT